MAGRMKNLEIMFLDVILGCVVALEYLSETNQKPSLAIQLI